LAKDGSRGGGIMHAKRVLSLDYDLGSLTALLIGIIGISAVSFLASSGF
jgi:hypothetical protein